MSELSPAAYALRPFKDDFLFYAPRALNIRTKDGQIKPFVLNSAQLYIHQRLQSQLSMTGKIRALVIKGRQQGISTYVEGRFFHKTSMDFGKQALILTHLQDSTDALFDMTRRYHDLCPTVLQPRTSAASTKELKFADLDSGFIVATAGSKAIGRGRTIQYFHGSEVAFWPNADEHFAGLGQAVPDAAGTEIILESTGNGVGNTFHQLYMASIKGKGDYEVIFVPWFWQTEYRSATTGFEPSTNDRDYGARYGLTIEQLAWRRKKIDGDFRGDEALFDQEYPACISAGQRVSTQRGIVPIEHVVVGDVCPHGEVSAFIPNGEKHCYKLTTEDGYSVIATADHRIKLSEGDFVRLDQSVGASIELCPPMFANEYAVHSWSPLPQVTYSVTIDETYGRFLGMFMGDGSYHDDTLSIVCDSQDQDVIHESIKLIEHVAGKTPSTRITGAKKGCTEVRAWEKQLREVFRQLGIIRQNGDGVRRVVTVPEVIWRSPKEVVRQFLIGLFEADGFAGYDYPRVVLFSKHKQFLADVQHLLLGFGVTCRLTSKSRNNKTHSYIANELTLRHNEAIKFGEEIGFISTRKSARVASWQEKMLRGIGRPREALTLSDVVESIEDVGVRRVYDLTVPETSMFDAGGISVHNCASMAFRRVSGNPLIDPDHVTAARATRPPQEQIEPTGPRLMGVDPAEYGSDASAIAMRQGRLVAPIKRWWKRGPMELVGLVAIEADRWQPEQIYVDCTGVGSGVADRLIELGYPVSRVHFGGKARQNEIYINRRAEMWGEMRNWFADTPCQVPDDDALEADLTAPQYTYDSSRRLVLESKEAMSKRGISSPDSADALALTFAEPYAQAAEVVTKHKQRRRVARDWRSL